MARFEIAFRKTSVAEGGYANVAGDTGGETYAGISRKWFPKWAGWKIVDAANAKKRLKRGEHIVDAILDQMVFDFYKKTFWDVLNADKIEDQVIAGDLYDFGVNAGQPRSIKELQGTLGVPQTGKPDALTMDAINNPDKYLSKNEN